MKADKFEVPIECRAADYDGPGRITGVILETGRVASDRAELFTANAPIFPSAGIELSRGHKGESIMTFDPIVDGSTIRIDAPLPDSELGRQVAREVRSGARAALSVSSLSRLDEARVMGVRELRSALITRRGVSCSSARTTRRAPKSAIVRG